MIKFREAVFSDVDAKIRKIEKEVEELKFASLAQTEEEQLNSAYAYIQQNAAKIKEEYRLAVAKADLAAKQEVLLRREAYRGTMLEAIRERLAAFSRTEEYRAYLLEKLDALGKERSLEGCELRFRPEDAWLKETAPEKGFTFTEDPSIRLGGFVLRSEAEGFLIDETFESKLLEQIPAFNQNCRLTAD